MSDTTQAEAALVEAMARALHWRGEGRKITWDEQLAKAWPGTWGVSE